MFKLCPRGCECHPCEYQPRPPPPSPHHTSIPHHPLSLDRSCLFVTRHTLTHSQYTIPWLQHPRYISRQVTSSYPALAFMSKLDLISEIASMSYLWSFICSNNDFLCASLKVYVPSWRILFLNADSWAFSRGSWWLVWCIIWSTWMSNSGDKESYRSSEVNEHLQPPCNQPGSRC